MKKFLGLISLLLVLSACGGDPEPTNQAPTVTISASATSGEAPLTVTFTASASDPDGDALTYAWTFGDGSNGSGKSATHSYDAAGSYTAGVTVSDGELEASAEQVITVETPSIPVPTSDANHMAGQLGDEYTGLRATAASEFTTTSFGEFFFNGYVVSEPVEAEGSFEIELGDPGENLFSFTDICPRAPAIDIYTHSFIWISEGDVLYDEDVLGVLGLRTDTEFVTWLYASEPLSYQGSCDGRSFDLNVSSGWSLTVYDGANVTSGSVPEGAEWVDAEDFVYGLEERTWPRSR